MHLKVIIFLIFTSIIIFSCSSCKTDESAKEEMNEKLTSTSTENLFFEGQITVVGNEPFTKLGLIVNDSTVYMLECNQETKDKLLNNQGHFYKIFVKEKIETKTGIKLDVIKTERIKK